MNYHLAAKYQKQIISYTFRGAGFMPAPRFWRDKAKKLSARTAAFLLFSIYLHSDRIDT
jgi:hypothetical protein